MGGSALFFDSLLGALAGLAAYGWMFWLGHMGGGDVKLLMALGALGGTRFALETGLLAVFIGGAIALVALVFTGRIVSFARRLWWFVQTLVARELEAEAPKLDKSWTMPFGVSIAAAAALVVFADPLSWLGVRPW